MMVKRLVALTFAAGVTLLVGSCSSFSDFVADSWPHFAGGEPKGLPPRPGDPGYDKFIAHGQPQQGAAGNTEPAATGETAVIASPKAAQAPSAFTEPSNQQTGSQPPPAIDGPRSDPGAVTSGLY